jgi:methylenetetrahydrofolate dehydrogenase (NADP+)/methenyltetrahydrofolate cyclohydrolase
VARILDGKAVAAEVRAQVAAQVAELKEGGLFVRLDVVLVGEDLASATYVASKQRDCAEVGIDSRVHRFPAEVSQKEIGRAHV